MRDLIEVEITFQGEGPHLEFVDVHTMDGRGISVGEWKPSVLGDRFQGLRVFVRPKRTITYSPLRSALAALARIGRAA